MSTKSIEEDFAAVVAAYHALPPAAERKDDSDASRASLMSNNTCHYYPWEDMTICNKGSFYCVWFDDVFQHCANR